MKKNNKKCNFDGDIENNDIDFVFIIAILIMVLLVVAFYYLFIRDPNAQSGVSMNDVIRAQNIASHYSNNARQAYHAYVHHPVVH